MYLIVQLVGCLATCVCFSWTKTTILNEIETKRNATKSKSTHDSIEEKKTRISVVNLNAGMGMWIVVALKYNLMILIESLTILKIFRNDTGNCKAMTKMPTSGNWIDVPFVDSHF